MAEDAANPAPPVVARRRRLGCWALVVALTVLAVGLTAAWLSRERIAGNVIANALASRGVHATYRIDRIGARDQVLRDIVVGDPARPDLTVERAIVRINPRLGIPTLGRITLIRPRLYGTYRRGILSFGELDPLLFNKQEKKPFELPDIDLAIEDGRALLETDYGAVGAKVIGTGNLQDGFKGELAATSPQLALAGCEAGKPTIYGRVSITGKRPRFIGPVRLDRLACPAQGIAVRNGAMQLDLTTDEQLRKFDGVAALKLGPTALPQVTLASMAGKSRFTWVDGGLTSTFALNGAGLASSAAAAGRLSLTGSLRARRNFDRLELDAQVAGKGVQIGRGLETALASAADGTRGTLLAPILQQVRRQVALESRDSSFAAEFTLRRTGQRTALVVPGATLRGGSGATMVSLTRFQLSDGPKTAPQFSGSFATGGGGWPRIVGTMEMAGQGGVRARLAMAEYQAGDSRLAIPELVLVQRADGALGFSGTLRASGPLPGGRADNLLLPLSGSWANGRLALWRECVSVRFDRLQYASLTLARQGLTLCPARGTPILRHDSSGLKLAAGVPSLSLAGALGKTPIAIRSGAVGFAYPGSVNARQVDVALGPAATAQRFRIDELTAKIGSEVSGRFAGTDVKLFSVPLDVLGASGTWRYAGGRLSLGDGAFRLEDRQDADRFAPLIARGADLTLENNVIVANALLREPKGDRVVTRVALRHDLNSGRGSADLAVGGITFGRGFQPADLTKLALGVVANVQGTVTGVGRIDWNERGVTSTGRFSSDALDFAAVFGPVKGASGTIEFTDLLGLTTAPNQRIKVASVNPGIEVNDGEVALQLRGGQVLAVQGGTWPFMGGTLTLRPVDITIGVSEERRYVLEIEGLDAARFVQRMELSNLNASGIFDGTVPIVFGADGIGRVEDGLLVSRPPGGNVSYVGALTYEDLSTMANFAFEALKSLNYRQMRVQMNGNLTGEIITNVRFDGVSQGEGTKQNFVTRQIAKLPFRFDVNIRAPFYALLTNIRSMYDPSMTADPRAVGLIDAQGKVIQRRTSGVPSTPAAPAAPTSNEPRIQRRESEDMP